MPERTTDTFQTSERVPSDALTSSVKAPVSYVLNQFAAVVRAEMNAALEPLGLTVSRYACLEALDQRPGLSNADLAQSTLVTRQAMSLLIRDLHSRGLITRQADPHRSRRLHNELTLAGCQQLQAARVSVRHIEQRMLSPLAASQQLRLRDELVECATAFRTTATQDVASLISS